MIQLYIEDRIVDLYGDETIEMNVVLRDFFDLTLAKANYTNQFSVPATQNNNDIFRLYFEPERQVTDDYGFKKGARLELNGTPYYTGYVLLDEGSYKNEVIQSYKLTFYTSDIAFFQAVSGISIKQLDWSNVSLNHGNKTATTTRSGMLGNGNANQVIYPLIQQFFERQNDATPGFGTRSKWTEDDMQGGTNAASWTELRPAIRLDVIWDLIAGEAARYGVTITSDYMSSNPSFGRLYLYLPYEFSDEGGSGVSEDFFNLDTYNTIYDPNVVPVLPGEIINVELAKTQGGARSSRVEYNLNYGTGNFTVQLRASDDGGASFEPLGPSHNLTGPGSTTLTYDFTNQVNPDVQLIKLYIYTSEQSLNVGGTYNVLGDANANGGAFLIAIGDGILQDFDVADPNRDFTIRIPDIKVNDFVSWIMRMFNMIIWSDDGVTYKIEPYQDWLASGVLQDLSDYVDMSGGRLTATLPESLVFSYEESDTVLQYGFNNLYARQYGNIDQVISSAQGQRAPGSPLEFDIGFTMPLWEKVYDKYLMMHCYDKDYVTITDEHLIFYYAGDATLAAGDEIDFNGWASSITSYKVCNAFYPYTDGGYTITDALTFIEEIDPMTNESSPVSLYSKYHEAYLGVVLDQQTRVFNYTGYVPAAFFNLSDPNRLDPSSTLKIGERYFLINKYKTNLVTGKTDFELFNLTFPITEPLPPPDDNTSPNIGVLSIACFTDTTDIVLTWTAATDNVGVVSYQIYRNSIQIDTTAGLTYTDTTADNSLTNNYYIIAVDAAGNKSYKSNIVTCQGTGFDYTINFSI